MDGLIEVFVFQSGFFADSLFLLAGFFRVVLDRGDAQVFLLAL
jgi:hypothetical protein